MWFFPVLQANLRIKLNPMKKTYVLTTVHAVVVRLLSGARPVKEREDTAV